LIHPIPLGFSYSIAPYSYLVIKDKSSFENSDTQKINDIKNFN
jgi:hypothetical protein